MAQNMFHHEEIYRGQKTLEVLGKQFLVICGVGALGSNLVDNLARQGFRKMRVIDHDRVENHNVNTQIYGATDVGALKVDALKNKMFRGMGVEIEAINKELTAANAKVLVKGASLVVDTFDNHASRKLVQDACREKNIPLLHAGLFEDYGEVVWDNKYKVPGDQTEGDVCDYPLARNIAMLTVIVATEEIIEFFSVPVRGKSWSITLKDLKVKEL